MSRDTRWISATANAYGKGGDPSIHKMMQVAIDHERESIAQMIEGMMDGPLTTKGVKAYMAASVRNLSCEE